MPSLNIDLHCHSNISDGVLSPEHLLARAAAQGVHVLALTDHDDVSGLPAARAAAEQAGIRLINGVEISVSLQNHTLHIVGLGVDPQSTELLAGLAAIREGRKERAERIAAQLVKAGFPDALAGAWRHAGNPELIGRLHFARYLMERGVSQTVQGVFNRYLGKGKPGYVSHQWVPLADALGWIRASGGQAVLAHPGRYTIGSGKMRALLGDFVAAGGEGIEVVTSNHTLEQRAHFAALANQFALLTSRGSDFHSPEETWRELGRLSPLPANCTPIWHNWALN